MRNNLYISFLRCLAATALLLLTVSVMAQTVGYRSFPHYNDMVERYAAEPVPDSTQIVMLGNSLTEFGGDWSELLSAKGIVNRGIIGDDATGIIHRLSQVCSYSPRAIFLECGTNDLSHGLTSRQVADSLIVVIQEIRRQAPSTPLYVQSVFPINEDFGKWKRLRGRTNDIPAINAVVKRYCDEQGVVYIDVFSRLKDRRSNKMYRPYCADGIHLTPYGYKVWADVLRPYIVELKRK